MKKSALYLPHVLEAAVCGRVVSLVGRGGDLAHDYITVQLHRHPGSLSRDLFETSFCLFYEQDKFTTQHIILLGFFKIRNAI